MDIHSKLSKKKEFVAVLAIFFFSFIIWITTYYFMFVLDTDTFIVHRIPAKTMEFERMKMEVDLRELDILFEEEVS